MFKLFRGLGKIKYELRFKMQNAKCSFWMQDGGRGMKPLIFRSFSVVLLNFWRKRFIARHLLRWLYQSQPSLKSITHTHQRLPYPAFVRVASGPYTLLACSPLFQPGNQPLRSAASIHKIISMKHRYDKQNYKCRQCLWGKRVSECTGNM